MDTQTQKLKEKVLAAKLPEELEEKLVIQLDRLDFSLKSGASSSYAYYEQTVAYIEWLVALPWNNKSEDILDIGRAKMVLEKNHYGLQKVKQRMLEFLSVIILQRKQEKQLVTPTTHEEFTALKIPMPSKEHLQAPILCFLGLVGTGKTTMAVSIAEALNRQLIRIPFGGLASALDLRGLSRVHPEAEPGIIMKSLRRVGVRNPVILLDELDRVSDDKRTEIMGVLVELLDPSQNKAFSDHYIDFPFDLSDSYGDNTDPFLYRRREVAYCP